MSRTSVKVSEDTYEMIIKNRGIFEQLFRRKLSLDESVYLSSRLISFIYETVQRLVALNRLKIIDSGAGSLKLEGFDDFSSDVVKEVIEEFTEINGKLAEKDKAKSSRLTVTAVNEEGA